MDMNELTRLAADWFLSSLAERPDTLEHWLREIRECKEPIEDLREGMAHLLEHAW